MKSIPERFWPRVSFGGKRDCWNWHGLLDGGGYGRFFLFGRKMIGAHRMSWILENGEVHAGLFVLHHCDNKLCCNPHHLWLGTLNDNNQDMVRKGRQACGETHGRAKLSDADVEVLRQRRKNGDTLRVLAENYGILEKSVCRIARGHVRKGKP